MELILNALIPIFALILIGYFFKRIQFPREHFWQNADKLTYYVLMPSLLVYKLSTAKLDLLGSLDFVLTGLAAILLILVLMVLINRQWKFDDASFTSVIQGGLRFNTYVFLALITALYSDEGLVLGALLIAFAIPLINVICITVFAVYVPNSHLSFLNVVKSIATNPLILGCFIGAGVNFSGLIMPIPVSNLFEILSSAALPMGLLSVGVGLELKSLSSNIKELGFSTLAKLIILPVLMFGLASVIGIQGLSLIILTLFASMPTAPSSFILARQLGGNIKLMSSLITVQTLISILTLAVVLKLISN